VIPPNLIPAISLLYNPRSDTLADLIDNTTKTPGNHSVTNPSVDALVQRWTNWVRTNPCANISSISSWPSNNPGFDKRHFCNAFKQTALYVWNSFYQSQACMNIPNHSVARDQCTVQGIIGFESKDKGMLNESVQAILRNVPYIEGDPKRYTFDKFILFWAPYDGMFNLDPYTRLVHNPIDGIYARGAYSFSIDDRFGNFSGRGSALIIDVGGSAALQNKEPYDFWEQYRVSYAAGWDHATVCGRPLNIPGKSAGSAGISFWRNGVKTTCDIVFYKTAAETGPQAQFAKYLDTLRSVLPSLRRSINELPCLQKLYHSCPTTA
jgi:hypothetical protein